MLIVNGSYLRSFTYRIPVPWFTQATWRRIEVATLGCDCFAQCETVYHMPTNISYTYTVVTASL